MKCHLITHCSHIKVTTQSPYVLRALFFCNDPEISLATFECSGFEVYTQCIWYRMQGLPSWQLAYYTLSLCHKDIHHTHFCYNLYIIHAHHMHICCHTSLNVPHTFIYTYTCTHACRETKVRMIRCPFLAHRITAVSQGTDTCRVPCSAGWGYKR